MAIASFYSTVKEAGGLASTSFFLEVLKLT